MKRQNVKIIDIDDDMSCQSKLELTLIPQLKRVEFTPILQSGYCGSFSLYVSDIDELIEYLNYAKLILL